MNVHKWFEKRAGLWRNICVALIAVSILTAGWLGAQRIQLEADHNRLELAVEHIEVVDMALENNLSFAQTLAMYQQAGVTSLFVKELSFSDYRTRIWFKSGAAAKAEGLQALEQNNYVVTADSEIADRMAFNLEIRDLLKDQFHHEGVYYLGTSLPLNNLWGLPAERILQINSIGLGWPLEDMRVAEEMGMLLQLQIKDWQPLKQESISAYFQQLEEFERISLVLFNSNNLFGYEDTDRKYQKNFLDVAQQIREMGVPLAQVEFFRQRGFQYMAQLMEDDVVRLHAVSPADQRRLGPAQSKDRLLLAAKDRNMRVLLVRQILDGDRDDLEQNLDYFEGLAEELNQGGLILDQAATLPPLAPAPWQIMVMASGVLAAGFLLAQRLGLSRLGLLAVIGGLILTGLLLVSGRPSWAQKIWALGSVVLFPVLSIDTVLQQRPRTLGQTLTAFMVMTAGSLIGALLMVGLLADRSFMLYIDGFTGVKVAHILPLLGVFVMYLGRNKRSELKQLVRDFLDMPLTLKMLILFGVGAGVFLLYVSRTGNEAATVSDIELMVRNRLEQLTGARPRTKEFLIGHPLMLLALFLGMRTKTTPWLALGIIGQVSIVNTYAHIHTPLLISIQRSLWGLGVGVVLGIILILFWKKADEWLRRIHWNE